MDMVPARMALSVSLIYDISYVHHDNAYDSDLYTFVFYPNIVSLCGITITVQTIYAGIVHAVDVRGCVDIQAQGPSRHTRGRVDIQTQGPSRHIRDRGRVVTMVYYNTTICLGNYRIHIT